MGLALPLFCLCDESDDDVLAVRVVSHVGGAQSSGGETPVERSACY